MIKILFQTEKKETKRKNRMKQKKWNQETIKKVYRFMIVSKTREGCHRQKDFNKIRTISSRIDRIGKSN